MAEVGGGEQRAFSGRGFRVFYNRKREPEERLYDEDADVSVIESSLATRGPHVRIYEGTNCVQLNVAEASKVIDALAAFIEEARAGLLTEEIPPGPEVVR